MLRSKQARRWTSLSASSPVAAFFDPSPQQRKPLLQIQGGRDIPQFQAEPHHRESDLRLKPYDNGFCSSQPDQLSHAAESADCKGIHTSRAVTSTITPRERNLPTRSARSSLSCN